MKLRKLEKKDAEYMLEWMHDPSVVEFMQANFAAKTIEDCLGFIESAQDTLETLNLAIVDDADEYMGTVSLKHIKGKTAEFGITIRKCAMGKGYSAFGMKEIIRIAFEERGLEKVYWCVAPENTRAIRFYDKNCYQRIDANTLGIGEKYGDRSINELVWYEVRKL